MKDGNKTKELIFKRLIIPAHLYHKINKEISN